MGTSRWEARTVSRLTILRFLLPHGTSGAALLHRMVYSIESDYHLRHEEPVKLADASLVGVRQPVKVAKISLGDEEAAWVRAVGIFEGETVEVLRAAIFGGPLHVRTGSGGEFALDRALAAAIDVEPLP